MGRELGSRRHNPEKVIDTWYYKVKDVEFQDQEFVPQDEREEGEPKYKEVKTRVRNKTVKVELIMEKTTKQSEEAPHPLDTVSFELRCAEIGQKLVGTDIEALRAGMWAMLDKKFEIKWERYYLVEVDRHHPYQGLGAGLTFSYRDIHKGTTWDGKVLMKIWRGGSYGSGDRIEPWPGEFTNKAGKVIACIPETDMNTAALEEFSKRVDELRKRLAEFLTPERIMETLTNLSGFALLPPAVEKQTCAECGEEYDPKDLDAVTFHSTGHKPVVATGIVGTKK